MSLKQLVMSTIPKYTILWDLDGTLLDTETIGVNVTKRVLEEIQPGSSNMSKYVPLQCSGAWAPSILLGSSCKVFLACKHRSDLKLLASNST